MGRITIIGDCPHEVIALVGVLEHSTHQITALPGDKFLNSDHARVWADAIIIQSVSIPDTRRLVKGLRAAGCQRPIALFSEHHAEPIRVQLFRDGLDQLFTRPISDDEILARIDRLVLGRPAAPDDPERVTSPSLERFGNVVVCCSTRTVTRHGQDVHLRPMEFNLLVALIRRGGKVASRIQLLEEVWGCRAAVVTRTVDTHMASLRHRIEENASEPRYLLTVPKYGYRLRA
jgi:two-component system KDP operon response regulator KdpE